MQSKKPLQALKELTQSTSTPYFDSLEVIERRLDGARPEEIYDKGDMHFNRRGYALWANGYSEFLLQIIDSSLRGKSR